MFKMNINNEVRVKLTDIGRSELKRQHNELSKKIPGGLYPYIPTKEDKDGWSKWQMWELMNTFGHLMIMGNDIPFETDIEIYTEKDK